MDASRLSLCKKICSPMLCCKRSFCKESKTERLFRKGRKKLNKDLNLVEMIRNQKIVVACFNELLETQKFTDIIQNYYKGNISSGDDLNPKDKRAKNRRNGSLRTLEDLDLIRGEQKLDSSQKSSIKKQHARKQESLVINLEKQDKTKKIGGQKTAEPEKLERLPSRHISGSISNMLSLTKLQDDSNQKDVDANNTLSVKQKNPKKFLRSFTTVEEYGHDQHKQDSKTKAKLSYRDLNIGSLELADSKVNSNYDEKDLTQRKFLAPEEVEVYDIEISKLDEDKQKEEEEADVDPSAIAAELSQLRMQRKD